MACGGSEPSVCSSIDDEVIKAEMATLKAQLRVLEAEQRAYVSQSQEQIRKQRCEIEYLQATQVEVQSSLRVCESHTHRQRDADDIQNLLTALEHRDEIDKLLETEKLTLEQLDKEILSAEHRLLSKWKVESARGYNQRPTQKTAQILEGDLNRCVIQFDTYLAQNSKLRKDMESLHIRRIKFQQIRQRMEEELEEVRGDIRGVVKLCTEAHDTRVEVQVMTMKMKDMAIKDLSDYDNEMKEMEMIIAQQHNLQEFLIIKCRNRSGEEDLFEYPYGLDMWEMREELSEEILASLDETFTKIHSFTGEDDLDVLVRRFLKFEDENRALFDYVSKQNDEAEALKHQISQIQQDTEQLHENNERKNTEHHVQLEDMQVLRQATRDMTLANNTKATKVTKTLDQARTGLARVVRRLDRQRNVVKAMPSSTVLTSKNLLDVLALVDTKITKLISIKSFFDSKNPAKGGSKVVACIPKPEAPKSPLASGTEDKKKKRSPTQKELRQQMIREILQREGVIWPGREKVVKTSSSQPRPEA